MGVTEEKKEKRFQFLNRLYELSGGDELEHVNMFKIGEELGFDKNSTRIIVQYLEAEGLIETKSMAGEIGILHKGVLEVEEALSNPNVPSNYFPPVNTLNIISVGQMTNSQIQQANSEATQISTITESKYEELKQVIQVLKESIEKLELPPQDKSDIRALIQKIDTQMSSSRPKSVIISESLKSLSSIKRILEGVASNPWLAVVLSQIASVIQNH